MDYATNLRSKWITPSLTILFIILVVGAIFSGGGDYRALRTPVEQTKSAARVQASLVDFQKALNAAARSIEPATVSIRIVRDNLSPSWNTQGSQVPGQVNPSVNRNFPQFRSPYYWQNGRITIASGVIFDPRGFVVTSYHVIKNARDISVTLSGRRGIRYAAQMVAADPGIDVAVIKMLAGQPTRFSACSFGDSDDVMVGDMVLAVGSPYGLSHSVTSGIVSDIRPTVNIEGRMYKELIQTDAAINHGSSGGPLVNLRGEVVGINAALFSLDSGFSGVGFAVPINQVKDFLNQIDAHFPL